MLNTTLLPQGPTPSDALLTSEFGFNSPAGLVIDTSGNLFVCDAGNHTIRRITSTGVVTTIAGSAGVSGTADGNGSAARFDAPTGITLNASGNLYVADSGNHAIRKITPAGDVTTFAGTAGTSGSTDATGTAARFNTPKGIAIDASGTVHVADSGNHTVRKITSAGVVTTVAGTAGTPGTANGTGTAARFDDPSGIAVTPDGFNIYVADTGSHTIRRSNPFNTLTPLADRVDGNRLYLWDNTLKRMLSSTDGGTSFAVVATDVNTTFNQFRTVPGKSGHLWAKAGAGGMYQSTNFGATFTKIAAVAEVYQFDFGKAAPSATYPAIFIWGKVGGIVGFFRSDDTGATWVRINDSLHNFGYQNDLAGDPRVYGRVYLATSGRGVIYGDFTNPPAPTPQPSQVLYDDTAQNGWIHAGTGGASLVSTSPAYRGTTAIAIPAGAGKAVALTGITGWVSNIAGKVTGGTSASPLLNPNDTTDLYSTNALQAQFSPITLANTGDKIILTGSFQMTLAAVASQSNWFRFGLYDNRNQAANVVTGWLGYTGMGNSLYERTADGLFSTGAGATQRTPDASPAPVSSASPSGNPPLAFEVTATRTATGIVLTHLIKRTDTNTTLMNHTHTDATPNNNGLLGTAQGTATGYTPTYNTAGFAFARSYVGSTGAQAQFTNIQIAFIPGVTAVSQFITFPAPGDTTVTAAPFALSATASSGLPVTFSLVSGPATLAGLILTITGLGTITVHASQSGNIDYLAATPVEQSFTVSKAPAEARTALESWRFEHFQSYDDTGSAANAADPDHDGIGNQMEYTYTRSKAALASVSFAVERSDSLAGGRWITDDIHEIAPPLADNGVTQTVKVVLPAGSGHRFIRLRVGVLP